MRVQGVRRLHIGEVVTILRIRAGLGAAELADLVNWPVSRIEALEQSKPEAIPTRAEAVELANALDVDPQMILVAVPNDKSE